MANGSVALIPQTECKSSGISVLSQAAKDLNVLNQLDLESLS